MKKNDLKKLMLLGLVGGLVVGAEGFADTQAQTSQKEILLAGGCASCSHGKAKYRQNDNDEEGNVADASRMAPTTIPVAPLPQGQNQGQFQQQPSSNYYYQPQGGNVQQQQQQPRNLNQNQNFQQSADQQLQNQMHQRNIPSGSR